MWHEQQVYSWNIVESIESLILTCTARCCIIEDTWSLLKPLQCMHEKNQMLAEFSHDFLMHWIACCTGILSHVSTYFEWGSFDGSTCLCTYSMNTDIACMFSWWACTYPPINCKCMFTSDENQNSTLYVAPFQPILTEAQSREAT